MPGGRPRTPTRVLQLRGTHRADRHGDVADEIQFTPVSVLPPAPGFFDEMASFEWHRVGPELVAKELLTEGDLAAFTMYCLSVSRVVAAERMIAKDGMMILTPQGFLQAHPAIAIARQCGAEVRKFAQEFGMTPSARTRVRTSPPAADKPKSAWDEVAGG